MNTAKGASGTMHPTSYDNGLKSADITSDIDSIASKNNLMDGCLRPMVLKPAFGPSGRTEPYAAGRIFHPHTGSGLYRVVKKDVIN